MWLYLNFPFGKFHSDIHNKMLDNNGTDLPHAADSDVSFGVVLLEFLYLSCRLKIINFQGW